MLCQNVVQKGCYFGTFTLKKDTLGSRFQHKWIFHFHILTLADDKRNGINLVMTSYEVEEMASLFNHH